MARVAAALLAVLVLAPTAFGKTILGLKGQEARFEALTGQHTTVGHLIVGWGQGGSWGSPFANLFATMGEIPMLGLSTRRGSLEAITPAQIAAGKGDDYLVALNAAVAAWGKPIYIRPFGEMNGYWNVYCAFTSSGKAKPGHSTASFRKAFARVYLIVHGGPAIELDAKLHKHLYDIRGKAEWAANELLYRAHPKKPYAIPEWGLWGIDDPDFVRKMGAFARSHPRLELLAYFESVPGSVFDLATKPRSRAAYRTEITTLG